MVSPAAISAAALLAEIEDLAQDGGKSEFVTVTAEADVDVYEGPGKNDLLKRKLIRGDPVKVFAMKEGWIRCFPVKLRSDGFKTQTLKEFTVTCELQIKESSKARKIPLQSPGHSDPRS